MNDQQAIMISANKLRAIIASKDETIKRNAATIKALQSRLRNLTTVDVDECEDMDSDTELEIYRNAVARTVSAKLARDTRILDEAAKDFDKDITPEEVAQAVAEISASVDETEDMTDEEEVEFLRRAYARTMGAGYTSD